MGEKTITNRKRKGVALPLAVMSSACGQHKKLQKLVRLIDDVHSDMMQ